MVISSSSLAGQAAPSKRLRNPVSENTTHTVQHLVLLQMHQIALLLGCSSAVCLRAHNEFTCMQQWMLQTWLPKEVAWFWTCYTRAWASGCCVPVIQSSKSTLSYQSRLVQLPVPNMLSPWYGLSGCTAKVLPGVRRSSRPCWTTTNLQSKANEQRLTSSQTWLQTTHSFVISAADALAAAAEALAAADALAAHLKAAETPATAAATPDPSYIINGTSAANQHREKQERRCATS